MIHTQTVPTLTDARKSNRKPKDAVQIELTTDVIDIFARLGSPPIQCKPHNAVISLDACISNQNTAQGLLEEIMFHAEENQWDMRAGVQAVMLHRNRYALDRLCVCSKCDCAFGDIAGFDIIPILGGLVGQLCELYDDLAEHQAEDPHDRQKRKWREYKRNEAAKLKKANVE